MEGATPVRETEQVYGRDAVLAAEQRLRGIFGATTDEERQAVWLALAAVFVDGFNWGLVEAAAQAAEQGYTLTVVRRGV